MHGFDKEGHPVCYNVFGEFRNKELYQKTFSDEEKRQNFLRWRIQFLEKSIRKLDFRPGGICTIVQVNDLKNSPGPAKWELRQATKQALHLLQDNYPEFVARQVLITMLSVFLLPNRRFIGSCLCSEWLTFLLVFLCVHQCSLVVPCGQ
ncbi:hypothetical protein PVK06_040152 [Gossypium arboreum]|uniref:CRAL-TRIO domain-containing protein n=1 Tax=Gossypium arboreum TaxID=29729 RepID=A0ABR0N4Z5_GOSAR|nr:hypothetical protein PVK06_040152 [Gossypium arboreum]